MTSEDLAARRLHVHGRRAGRRLRVGQQRLMDVLLPRVAIRLPPPGTRLDPSALFDGPVADIWLEIGFGGGEHLAEQARAHPEIGLIGCEVFRNGVASLLGHLERFRLANLRIHPDDARPLLDALPEASIGRAFVLFPDPWPKTRHTGRRFIGPDNLDRLARVLRDGAELRIASDDPGHISWVLEQCFRHPGFRWMVRGPEDWRERPGDWPQTRYERKAIAEGRRPAYFRFTRRARSAREDRPFAPPTPA